MRVTVFKGILVVVGVAALTMVFGSLVFAAEDTEGKMTGPSMEMKKENIDKPSLGLRDDLVAPELTKELERPMSAPDSRAEEMVMPDRRPLCGAWGNAINNVYCVLGYEYLSP